VTAPAPVRRGADELHRLLGEQTFDLRRLDLAGFRHWLERLLARWQPDPVFARRVRIRDLRRSHPRLRTLEEEHRRAARADEAAAPFPRLRRVEQDLTDAGKAIAGLTDALGQAAPENQPALRQKLEAFQARRQALRDEEEELTRSSPERQTLVRFAGELQQLRTAVGLDREEDSLEWVLRQQGRRSGHAGGSFEELALALTRSVIVPELLADGGQAAGLQVLPGVTLGAARVEFDQLVIRPACGGGQPVEVLAVVEAKNNINDLAHGFRLRRENLAWLTGATDGYDPDLYRTGHFRSGHFDREAVHEHGGASFLFARDSFCHFRQESATGLVVDRLYFITRGGPLWGISSAALARIGFRIATDERWAPESDPYLEGLRRWCLALAEPIETPDVLQSYASAPGRGSQVLLAAR
jgi:hypothetical protein